jgi:uncharacterized membrane protein
MGGLKGHFLNFVNTVSPVKFFIGATLTFGFIFIVITPPFETPDEQVHFLRAYQVSEFNFIPDKARNITGGYLPASLDRTISYTMTNPNVHFNANKKYNMYKTFQAASFKTEPQKKKLYDFSSTSYYSPIAYLPQAAGILIARILNLAPLGAMYAGRIGNLLAWTILLALSIRLMPRKKWTLVAVALLPIAIFQSISLSTDVMTVGLMALAITLIFNFRECKKAIDTKWFIGLLTTLICLVLCKQVMFLFLPAVLLIPNRVLGKNAVLKKLILILVPLIIFGVWMLAVKNVGSISNPINHEDPVQQTNFILHNPHSFINVLWNTYLYRWGDSITGSFIGIFGWQDAPLSELFIVFGYISLAFLLFSNYTIKPWLNRNQKLLLAVIAFVYWLAVSAALYVYYSPVGYKIIVGLQGRYFLPLAILAIPILYGGWLRTSKIAYRRVAVLAPIVLLLASTITIYVRYFVNNV